MGKALRISIVAALLSAASAACTSTGCLENGSAIPLARMCDSATGQTLTLDSLRIYGLGAPADSSLTSAADQVSEVYLPVNPAATTTAWVIEYRRKALLGLSDTVAMTYEAIPYLASDDCGAMYAYRVKSLAATTHLIDSIELTETLITNAESPSIRIYFRTRPAGGTQQ